jgi:hypothetical protein
MAITIYRRVLRTTTSNWPGAKLARKIEVTRYRHSGHDNVQWAKV